MQLLCVGFEEKHSGQPQRQDVGTKTLEDPESSRRLMLWQRGRRSPLLALCSCNGRHRPYQNVRWTGTSKGSLLCSSPPCFEVAANLVPEQSRPLRLQLLLFSALKLI